MRGEPTRAEQRLHELTLQRRQAEASVSLAVAILGDGRGTPEYQKRLELRERLSAHQFVGEVTIPEILLDTHPGSSLDDIERSAIETADVVICLEGPHNPPLGLYTEVLAYLAPGDLDKWFRLQPWDRADGTPSNSLVAGLVEDSLQRIETQGYDVPAWETCDRITAACARRIKLVGLRSSDQMRDG